MIRAETNDTVIVDLEAVGELEPCNGPGSCHGCMAWCDRCGDVDRSCDATRCDVHRCQSCHQIRIDRDQERSHCYLCWVCDPTEYPHRWPAFVVVMYAIEVEQAAAKLGRVSTNAAAVLDELDAGIERIVAGDPREGHTHPRSWARRLGLTRG